MLSASQGKTVAATHPEYCRSLTLLRAGFRRVRQQIAALVVVASFFSLAGLPVSRLTSSASAAPQKRARAAGSKQIKPATPPPQTTPPPAQTPATPPAEEKISGQRVKLFYLREGTKIALVLNTIAQGETSGLKGLMIGAVAEDEIVLIGTQDKRDLARRIIATLDLPRPGVQMEMWGIQISSRKPEDLAEVMERVRREIDQTQQAVRETYSYLQEVARNIPDGQLDGDFKRVLVDDLHYNSALDPNRTLSLSDILLRLIAAEDPVAQAASIANNLDKWLNDHYPNYTNPPTDENSGGCKSKRRHPAETGRVKRRPFERFFLSRGLRYVGNEWVSIGATASENAKRGKVALLNFALQYGRLVHDEDEFSPYYLQQAAGALNTRLQTAIDALNLDMQDLFAVPTLDRIRRIVGGFCDVEYAQVGKTSVATLSGIPTIVTSYSVNAFDVKPPLRLSELLTKAQALSQSATPFVPNAATQNMVGALPLGQFIGLLGAFGEERSVWRELKSGVSLSITPNVLRNMTSAELDVDLKTGDPQAGTREQNVPPLSRVSQHDVNTKVYVNALDFFDLSAFGSQSTLNGGRGYVPIIGPVWRGLFGEAPVIGSLFSWRRPPQNVYSQSLVLTTSFITPTAMGVALLIPTDRRSKDALSFTRQQESVECYEAALFGSPVKLRKDGTNPCQK
ncbi:MAG TPA: hypothetical protein VGV59_05805 [Pyrinomonadaceae bacterium]|nr:hypothetical protein [Pyrinomonadaceae bacterium]